jgi:4-hydroxy 2-oxovalerate aldolase
MSVNIDVTLRDGGYRNGFNFPLDYARRHARLSVEAGFDWVEIAYRKGSFKPAPQDGLTGRGEDEYIAAVAADIGPRHVCVILHPKNIDDADLPAMYAAGARLVRICLPAQDPGPGLAYVRQAKELGFTVSVNLTRVSQLPTRTLVRLASSSSDAGADVLYLADSNGSLSPDTVGSLVAVTRSVIDGEVGLHAHNNLGLALANAIAADAAGATWMDSAVLGMGKGPGNLIAEQWLAHLDRTTSQPGRFDLGAACELSDLLLARIEEARPALPLADLLLGHFDLSVEHRGSLVGGHREKIVAARALSKAR